MSEHDVAERLQLAVAAERLRIDFSAEGLQPRIAFEADYDFYLVSNASDKVVRYRADGASDPSFVHEGFGDVLGTNVIPISATRLAIARSIFGGHDVALHDETGQRVPSFGGTGLITLPYNSGGTVHANDKLYVRGADTATTRGRIESISLGGAVTTITTTDRFAMDNMTDFNIDGSSRVLIGGKRGTSALVGRLTTAGQADTTFGIGGAFEVASPFAETSS